MAEKIWAVYLIQSLLKPQRVYVGSTVNYHSRTRQHKYLLKNGKHSSTQLQNHFNKYGLDDLSFEILESGSYVDIQHLLSREQGWYNHFCFNGRDIPYFNINRIAGTTLGYRHTPESKLIISEASKNSIRKPMSQETRDLLSDIKKGSIPWNKGKITKPETIEKHRQKMLGFRHSEESKEKIREKLLGVPKSKESIEKRTKTRNGLSPTQETRDKISATLKKGFKEHPEWGEAIRKRQRNKKKRY